MTDLEYIHPAYRCDTCKRTKAECPAYIRKNTNETFCRECAEDLLNGKIWGAYSISIMAIIILIIFVVDKLKI